jgi:hypothetical protein
MRWITFALVAAMAGALHTSAVAQDADWGDSTPPSPGLTNTAAVATFTGALMKCVQSRLNGGMISDLPNDPPMRLRPAPAGDRWVAGPPTSDEPLWITDQLGGLLVIAEPSRDRCEVNAIQLPVDRTFQTAIYTIRQVLPDFTQVHVEPGYNPIAYELELIAKGARYVVHMEGAEPGAPGHELRFSLIHAYVTREAPGQP